MRKNWNRQEQKNNMNRLAKWWQSFDEKHPIAARWIREGGLFVIVSNLITVFKIRFITVSAKGICRTSCSRFWMAGYSGDTLWRNF